MELNTSRQSVLPPAKLLLLAAFFGFLTGLIEIPFLGLEKAISHRALFLGPRVIWMAPVTDVVLFILVGFLLLLFRLRSARMALGIFSFLAFLSWLLIFPRIQWYASVLLAVGIAAQASRFLAPRITLHPSFFSRSVKVAAVMTLLLIIAVEGGLWLHERQSMQRLPAAKPDAPNVLLIVMDTVRAQSLSLYGYERETSPQLARFARRGVVFDQAISTAPWTTPSHAALFTGHYPFECSTDWDKPLDGRYPTLAETLGANGYATAGFIANTFGCGYETGLDRGFLHYEDYSATVGESLISSSLLRSLIHSDSLRRLLGNHQVVTRKSAAEINHDFLAWQARQRSRPFFAFLNYLDAHEPYLPPPPFNWKFGTSAHKDQYQARHDLRISFRYGREHLSAEETQAEIDDYDGAIAYLDQQIGLLLEELERRGTLKNTLVVITADHGESFGEHKDYGHGNSLYLSLLHVPLLVVYPARVPPNRRIADPISLRDLPGTILDLTGIGDKTKIPGYSLACHWTSEFPHAEPETSPVLSEVNVAPIRPGRYPAGKAAKMQSVLQEPIHYIRNANGKEEIYNIVKDPDEESNLLNEQDLQLMLKQLRSELMKLN
ncbi:MAG: sulfatase-like hydrolase/transferase [Acidobacteria bacterium]|nr:sulfatase-like hydrolase/transferase [Acidobacteriota bacterium]